MRLIHFSDLHIGVENYGRIDAATGLSTRLLDFLSAFDELVDFAVREQVDAVIFSGDAYKSRDPSQTHQREFAKRIARLAGADIPVYLLVGNHDLPNALGRATALEIFNTLDVQNVYVGANLEVTVIPTRSGPLQIVGLPWVTRSRLLRLDQVKNVSLEELRRLMEELLVEELTRLCDSLDPELPAVLSGHLTLSAATIGSERTMMIGHDPVIMKSDISHPRLDYVALGHVHKKQEIPGPIPIAYSGSMQRVDFGEEHDDKGFFLIDLDETARPGERVRSNIFVPVQARAFQTITIQPHSVAPTEEVVRHIEERVQADAVVRVLLKLSPAQATALDERAVRLALAPASYIAAISRELSGEARPRLGDVPVGELTPTRLLELYLEQRKDVLKGDPRLVLGFGKRLIEQSEHIHE